MEQLGIARAETVVVPLEALPTIELLAIVAKFVRGRAEISVFEIVPPALVSTMVEFPVAATGSPTAKLLPPVPDQVGTYPLVEDPGPATFPLPEIELHPNPVLVVHVSALVAVEQLGIARAEGLALAPVPFPVIVLLACVASTPRGIVPAPDAVPVKTGLGKVCWAVHT